jgi:hypothetical protein
MADHYTLTLGGLRVTWDAPREGAVSLSLHGDLDNVTVPVLRQVLDTIYDQRCFVIRLDLAQLAFIAPAVWAPWSGRGGTARRRTARCRPPTPPSPSAA